MNGNVRSLQGENMEGYLSKDEQLFLAKFHRFIVEFMASYQQKHISTIPENVKIEQLDADGVPVEWLIVPEAREDKLMLYLHGGGYILGSPNYRRLLTLSLGKATNLKVLNVDYRLAPEHPYPAGLEDCVTAYNWLLSQGFKSKNIVIVGDSAGGYFTIITLVRLRDREISLPAGAVCLSPATSLENTSESYSKNAPSDPVLADLGVFWWPEAYLDGKNPRDPLISPCYADLTGLPPILVQVSSSEMLYDDSTQFAGIAKKAGLDVTLQVWNNTLHVFHAFGLPESQEAIAKIKLFVDNLLI
ncbi:MAG: alpha/beta hydrolase [Candidatus Hodarchaeales archaeon]